MAIKQTATTAKKTAVRAAAAADSGGIGGDSVNVGDDLHTPGSQAESARIGAGYGFGGIGRTLSKLMRTTSLTGEANEFLQTITEILTKDGGKTVKPIPSEIPGMTAVIDGDRAILLLFNDVLNQPSAPPGAPLSLNLPLAISIFEENFPEQQLVNAIMVSSDYYKNANAFARYVSDTLTMLTNPSLRTTVSEYSENTIFTIDRSLQNVREQMKLMSPGGALPYINAGFVVRYRSANHNNAVRMGLTEAEAPLMVVGANVDIIRNMQPDGSIRFTPVVRIVAVYSAIPSNGLAILALGLAADQFNRQNAWCDAYRDLSSELNVGFLVPDSNGDPQKITNEHDFANIIQRFFTAPILAVDLVDGDTRPAAFSAFLPDSQALHPYLAAAICEFYDVDRNSDLGREMVRGCTPPSVVLKEEIVGRIGADHRDTRSINYFKLIAGGASMADAQVLLEQPRDPLSRANLIRSVSEDWRPISTCTTVMLGQQFIMALNAVVRHASLRISSAPSAINASFFSVSTPDLSGMGDLSQSFGGHTGWNAIAGNRRGFGGRGGF